MEQLVARRAHNPKVRGSSPLPATQKRPVSLHLQAFFYAGKLRFANQDGVPQHRKMRTDLVRYFSDNQLGVCKTGFILANPD